MIGDYSPMKTFNESFSPNKGYGIRVSLAQKGSFPGQGSPVKMIKGQHLNINGHLPETILINDPSPETKDGLGAGLVPMQPLQGFGEYDKGLDETAYSGQLYLKTKTERLKEHWGTLSGNELYFYRKQGDTEHRLMHILTGTFIKEMPVEYSEVEEQDIYPVKIVLPPNKSRILYFMTQEKQAIWLKKLREVVGDSNMFDYYNLEDNIGKGQFGLVKLATHRKNGQKVAIKIVNKKDMKPIEIY